MKTNTHFKLSLLASALFLATGANALEIKQQDKNILFDELDSIQYQAKVRLPDGQLKTFKVSNGDFSLTAEMLGLDKLENGLYKYELTPIFEAGDLSKDIRQLNDTELSAEYAKAYTNQNKSLSGVFTIAGDILADKNLIDPAMMSNKSSQVVDDHDVPTNTRDQQILDDLIVDGSACIGQDCVNGESFGFDTIRIKENNLRIRAVDTSTSASFPTRDWQITFNDSANGGANKFSIDDIDGGRTPFTLEAGAPSHSLYVDDGGRIGLGTSTPVVQVHVVDGNTPTLRLEQDGSSGFTPQTWDVAGNEANFFVRDATNGSTLPFRIEPGAPSNAIYIDTGEGHVGFGTASPADELHIVNAGATRIRLENTSATSDTTNDPVWNFNSNGTLRVSAGTSGAAEFVFSANGDLAILGSLTTAGTICNVTDTPLGCDMTFSDDYKLATIEEHAEQMYQNSYLPNVGPTIENQPFNITEKTGGMLNELEKAHIYIAQLNDRLKSKESELSNIKTQFTNMEQRLSKLEIK